MRAVSFGVSFDGSNRIEAAGGEANWNRIRRMANRITNYDDCYYKNSQDLIHSFRFRSRKRIGSPPLRVSSMECTQIVEFLRNGETLKTSCTDKLTLVLEAGYRK